MEKELSAPQIDGRMDLWFGEDQVFDHEIVKEFSDDVERASEGDLDHWAHTPRGRLALILLLDQFRRNIYRNTADAFIKDKAALKLCVEGAMEKKDNDLSPIQRVFFYMPLQHAESRRVQKKSCEIYKRLSAAVSPTYKETFETVLHFAELLSSNSAVFRTAINCWGAKTQRKKTSTWRVTSRHSGKANRRRRGFSPEPGCSHSRLKPLLQVPIEKL
jgi:uncharacterized protein (DUF924 family)